MIVAGELLRDARRDVEHRVLAATEERQGSGAPGDLRPKGPERLAEHSESALVASHRGIGENARRLEVHRAIDPTTARAPGYGRHGAATLSARLTPISM